MTWPTPHPIYVAAGMCLCFCSGMGHLPLLVLALWWFWQYFSPPCPLYYTKLVQRHLMTSDVVMVMDQWWSLHVLSEPLCKSPARFPYVFLFTVYPDTPDPVDHSTLLQDGVSIFGVYQVLDGVSSFEIHINPMFSANIFAALPHALNVWDNYVWLVVIASFVGCVSCPLISVCLLFLMDVDYG